MQCVSVVGYRDVGKTSLVERLVPALGEFGRVATVKSIHHDVEIDTPETDTHRHRTAGADAVVGVAPSQTFEIRTEGKTDGVSLDSILADLRAKGYEFVVVEGFKEHPLPSIVVGDIHPSDLGGSILQQVPEQSEADIDEIVSSVRALDPWEAQT